MSEKEKTPKILKVLFSINEKVAQIYLKSNGKPRPQLEAEERRKKELT